MFWQMVIISGIEWGGGGASEDVSSSSVWIFGWCEVVWVLKLLGCDHGKV